MASDEQVIDWVNLPESIPTLSFWDTLHDGDRLAVKSDLLARTVTLRFDVGYIKEFHHLPEQTQFTVIVSGVQSARPVRNVPWPSGCAIPSEMPNAQRELLIAEYHRKWREESQSWTDFELMEGDLEVSNATLARSSDVVALRLGLLAARDSYVEANIRGEGIAFYVGERQVTPEEFVALGETYWTAFAAKRKKD